MTLERHSKHPPYARGAWFARYGFAIAAVCLALLLQWLLVPLFGAGWDASPFMMFFAAVMVGAYLGGLGPGLLATGLSALFAWYFFLSPQFSLQLVSFGQGLRIAVFALEGAVISLLVEAMHSARWRAEVSRRQAEEDRRSLRESEERYRTLVESAEDYAIFMMDPEGRIVNWNAGAERLFGYREDEIVGEPGSRLFVPEDVRRGAPGAELRRAETEGRAEDERWHARKDGSRLWASGFVRPIRDWKGGLRGFSKVARDVTERREAEERARFLADLNAAMQPLTDPDELTATAARMLGEHLGADRCAYAEVEADEDHFRITGDYARGLPSIVGRFAMSSFGSEALRLMRENEPYVVFDAEADERVSEQDLAAYRQTQIRAVVSVALHKAGRFAAGMAVHQKTPRRWTPEEVELVRTVADRCWESMERARVVRDLRRSEERFRTLADNISQLAWMADERGWIFWYNKRWFDFTGTTLEEMQGWGWKKVHHPDHVDRVVERVQRSWDTGEPWEDTFPLRRHDGVYRWFLSRARPIRDEAGRIVRWFGTNTDVTEQREAEERYRAVIEQSAEGIYLVDADTKRILEANPAFHELLGYAPGELRGTRAHEHIALPAEEVDAAVRRTLEMGRRIVGERRYRRKDGTLVEVEVGASVISYGGRCVICAVVRDMTERRRAEEALRAVREAERRRMARDLHDGPLQDLSYAAQAMEILRIVPPEDEPAGILDGALEALRRAAREVRVAVNDLRREERERPFPELLASLLERARAMAPDQDVRLASAGDGDLQMPLGRRGEELLSVVQEALTNARRHSGAKNVWVDLFAEGEELVIEVADDGRGLGPGAAPGVGLSSMRERAAALGGKLEVESEIGGGTTVRLRVPRSEFAQGSAEQGSTRLAAPGRERDGGEA